MSVRQRTALVGGLLSAGLVAAGLTAGSAGAVPQAPARALPAATPVVQTAVLSPSGVLYTRRSNETAFHNLGGQLDSTPAVLALPDGQTWYFGHSPNGTLYVRSDTAGWRPAADPGVHCLNPAASLVFRHPAGAPSTTQTAFVVACRGDSNHLITLNGFVGETTFPHWAASDVVDEGGVLVGGGGPAIYATNSDFNYLVYVVGGSYGSGNVYATEGGGPPVTFWHVNLTCGATPAVSAGGSPSRPDPSSRTYLACAGAPGNQLLYAISSDGLHFGAPVLAGGAINEPVGLAVRPDGLSALAYVQGEFNHILYVATVTPSSHTGFTNLGGQLIDGVKAANLG